MTIKPDTLQYYNQNADAYNADTQQNDMSAQYHLFLPRVAAGGHILDLGCGSGRDSLHFLQQGYQVTAVDGSEALCRIAARRIGQPVQNMLFEEIGWQNAFDGVWACASLLHCAMDTLPEILQKVADSLKPGGVLYVSFKYGDFAGWKDGRYFTYLTEKTFRQLLGQIPELEIVQIAISGDVRQDRASEQWLNAVARKVISAPGTQPDAALRTR